MNHEGHQPGFFPSLLSVGIFLLILIGMFFGFTRAYPQLVHHYQQQRGQTVETDTTSEVVQDIAPFVRGVLSGVQTAAQVGNEEPQRAIKITEVRGYQHGVRTALLTSRNWYNLDRQLFRVKGLAAGMIASSETSKVQKDRGTLEYQIKLIQRIQTALSVNLEELLSANNDNRQQVLENYLEGLKKMASESSLEVASLLRRRDEASAEIAAQNSAAEQFDANFTDGSGIPSSGGIDQNLDLFLEARKKAEEARIEGVSVNQIVQQLGPLDQRLKQVISAIQANFDALAAGVKVTPTPGVNLPLFQEN